MSEQITIDFDKLQQSDLYVDALYRSGRVGNAGDDPISKLLSLNNQGGFRHRRNPKDRSNYSLCALYSSGVDPDWPDSVDYTTGIFTYYGDNKRPGSALENTHKGGNVLLRHVFDLAHGDQFTRFFSPPFFIFLKAGMGRDVEFKGLAVPGGRSVPPNEDLVAIWKVKDGKRFQNYRAIFTILDIPVISRKWIKNIVDGDILSDNCPPVYRLWAETGQYTPLQATNTITYRSSQEQLPNARADLDLLESIIEYFKYTPTKFEYFAAELVKMMDRNVGDIEVTRPTRDGGRDGVGKYKIGMASDPIFIDFALEAKCYSLSNSVGVKETSRLISRLRHRQFGVLVTTSYVALQAYQEIKDDNHPVLIISGKDIVKILHNNSLGNVADLKSWLTLRFPI